MRIFAIRTFWILSFIPFSASAADMSVMDIASLFGISGAIIVGLSLLTLAVVLERFKHFSRKNIVPKQLLSQINDLWHGGEHQQIQQVCADNASTLANTLSYVNKHRHHGFELVSNGAGDVASLEFRKHLEKIYPLAVVATIAPLAGLLGTVVGMIEAFYIVAATGAIGDASILADGIYKALFTTAAGLFVALPAMGFHHYFKSKVTLYSLELEEQVSNFISDWFSHKEHLDAR